MRNTPFRHRSGGLILSGLSLLTGCISTTQAQDELTKALSDSFLLPEVAERQHQQFVLARIKPLQKAADAPAWQREADRLRQRVLDEVVFRGVPASWRHARPRVIWSETIEAEGYRIKKLRFEAVPGLWIPALLYEPAKLSNKVPAVLNVNGHAATGKSTSYKQMRCVHLAKSGMLAMNLEWIGMGQLRTPGFQHNQLAKLDLCGRSGLSIFFCAMQRGLDVLLDHKHADLERTAVTGLSGGGWQTIVLSSLDPRVKLSVPVAGHSALAQRVAHRNSIGDLEQNPCDLASIADYVHLNALMVPRPLLLIYNTRDDCCFVASTVKANTYQPIIPFYSQAGVPDRLGYYENSDPGTHNYELDNRLQLYRFLDRHFLGKQQSDVQELAVGTDVRTAEDLEVRLPPRNADFHSLAKDAARDLPRPLRGSTTELRRHLKVVLRYHPNSVTAQRFTGPKQVGDVALRHLLLQWGEEWVLPARVVEGKRVERHVVLLADAGMAAQADRARALAADGARVLLLDPVLIGHARPPGILYQNAMLLAAVGERPLGLQTAQVAAVCRYFRRVFVADNVSLEAHGPRTALIARCVAACEGKRTIAELRTTGGARSLKEYLQPPASFGATPEAFCFGLLEYFDVPQLEELAAAP